MNNYEPSDYYGTDGFGDFNFSQNITAKLNTSKNASALLVDLVKQYAGISHILKTVRNVNFFSVYSIYLL